MEDIEILQILAGIIVLFIIIGYFRTPKSKKETPEVNQKSSKYDDCDIVELANGKYTAKYKDEYVFLTSSRGISLHNSVCTWNSFSSYEQAKDYLDEWLAMKGKEEKSLGIKE